MSGPSLGGVEVTATDAGFPTDIQLTAQALRLGAAHIAREVLNQCHRAATVGGITARQELEKLGISPRSLNELGVPNRNDLEELMHSTRSTHRLNQLGISR
ncbi:hypothetical protein IEU95_04435 [Hoyosella rhizosphaerae]|uniref:Uncharacterized protein n=1 Tax=Hoyosella rhizosphaerae TaxID=1755582 RepID=A0A916U9T8_9ACTN|nr:hypothetical protein [Hoyosella rhizosphaerae]MBN4926063.1 hypothetical protein [Hoyosella rhizosphaerae]GGC65850.1 hypothetical protein GCM10011410_17990 [Hoyosella rhizosphaerae]